MNIPTFTMAGKVVLVTGGRTGIGRALALAFAEAGADVAICSRTIEGGELEAVADEIRKLGRHALAIRADVSHKADVENMVKKTVAELGNIDVLINNAGIIIWGSLFEAEEDTWDKVIDINLKGPYLCSQAVGRLMVERRKGNIINIASTSGLRPSLNRTAYSVSKAGLAMLTRVLARELGRYNICVNAIAPGMVETPMTEDMRSKIGTKDITSVNVPLGCIGEIDGIVGAALFLASDAAGTYEGGFLWQPSVILGKPNTFLGYPIHTQDDMATLAGTEGVIAAFGNFMVGYRILDHTSNMSVQRLVELYAEAGLIGFKVHKRVGGYCIRPANKSIVLLSEHI